MCVNNALVCVCVDCAICENNVCSQSPQFTNCVVTKVTEVGPSWTVCVCVHTYCYHVCVCIPIVICRVFLSEFSVFVLLLCY